LEKSQRILTPFQHRYLQGKLQESDLNPQLRQRIEIMLLADEGKTQSEICRQLGCSTATAGRWILYAKAQMAHQYIEIPTGRPRTITEQYLQRLQELVQSSPGEQGYTFRRWTANWLSKHLAKELGITVSDRHISRLLRDLGLSTLPPSLVPAPEISGSKITIGNLVDASPPDRSPI
jgi:transposase